MDMKLCKRCGTEKPLTEFYANSTTKDRRQYWCKACSKASVKALHRRDPAKHAAYNRGWDKRNPDKKADTQLKGRLGVPHGTYAEMLLAHEGRCAICGTDKPGDRIRRFHVDHDARTGKIRGLLCGRCNTGIGQFLHDPHRLKQAIAYLLSKGPGVTNG